MNSFVQNSNLPQGNVRLCAIGQKYESVIAALNQRGISCFTVRTNSSLPSPVSAHADMQICHLGGDRLLAANSNIANACNNKYSFQTEISEALGRAYPKDVKLNCAFVGKYCFANPETIDKKITNHCIKQSIQLISVKQGYTKCSICIVNEYAMITSDKNIASSALKAGLDVLLVRPGFIRLDGYDTGFIGGCTGLIAKDTLAFTGTIDLHPDGGSIKAFLKKHCAQYVELCSGPLWDIGSIIPLMESMED